MMCCLSLALCLSVCLSVSLPVSICPSLSLSLSLFLSLSLSLSLCVSFYVNLPVSPCLTVRPPPPTPPPRLSVLTCFHRPFPGNCLQYKLCGTARLSLVALSTSIPADMQFLFQVSLIHIIKASPLANSVTGRSGTPADSPRDACVMSVRADLTARTSDLAFSANYNLFNYFPSLPLALSFSTSLSLSTTSSISFYLSLSLSTTSSISFYLSLSLTTTSSIFFYLSLPLYH